MQYQLTSDQIQELQDLLNAGNRAGFYLQFYNDTVEAGAPSAEVPIFAEVSSLSGVNGDAVVASSILKD